MWVGVDLIFQQVISSLGVFRIHWLYFELSHGCDECFGAINDVFVDGEAVEGQFVLGVAILMDDFHLFYNRRLAALARACQSQSISVRDVVDLPSNSILHSFRNRLESSSSRASMALDRFLFSSSSAFSWLMQAPMMPATAGNQFCSVFEAGWGKGGMSLIAG